MSEEDRPLPPVVVKKYANRRLYDTESSIYITLDILADMVRQGRDFVVYDAKTGDDITRAVLTQIIMEEETKGRNMLPTSFLRRLISFYGDSMQGLVPEYLEQMMEQFAAQHGQVRASMQRSMQALAPSETEEPRREQVPPNVAVIDRGMTIFPPFTRAGQDAAAPVETASGEAVGHMTQDTTEILALREEVARLREELTHLSAGHAELPVRTLARSGARR